MYANYHYNIELEDVKEHLRAIFELILKPSKKIINKIKERFNETEIKEIRYHINCLYHEMDGIAHELKKNEFFYDEYFDFCEIEDLIKYTLNRDLSIITESDFDFMSDLIKDFYNLIDYKLTLAENEIFDDGKYNHRYEAYLSDFDKSKTYFYNNICDETMDEDLFIQYCNVIVE